MKELSYGVMRFAYYALHPCRAGLQGQTNTRVCRGQARSAFHAFAQQAEKRLEILDNATRIEDLMVLLGNRFKALGNREGQFSIRIEQWRICFEWAEGTRSIKCRDYGLSLRRNTMARTPIHPGMILADELTGLGVSAAALARTLHVPANRITRIIKGQRAIIADTAVRLSK